MTHKKVSKNFDLMSEEFILSCILEQPDIFNNVQKKLSSEDMFYGYENKIIYASMLHLYNHDNDIDEITFMQLHHHGVNVVNRPFVRLTLTEGKDGRRDGFYAAIRKNENTSGDNADIIYMGEGILDQYFPASILVKNNTL